MYATYKPSILGVFFKECRKNHDYTLSKLSEITHYSVATISMIENTETIMDDDKTHILLNAYNLPNDYLEPLLQKMDGLVDSFIKNIIYINEDSASNDLCTLSKIMSPYKNTVLSLSLNLCQFIYDIFMENKTKDSMAAYLDDNSIYLSESLQYITNIYIAQYYLKKRKYASTKKYLDLASKFSLQDHDYNQMLNYFLALYYLKTNDPFNSLQYSSLASDTFTKKQNYKRLLNINILSSLQYMNIGYYTKAQEINKKNLIIIQETKLDLELRIVLFNIAFTYIINENFHEAIKYLSQIPENLLNEKHYCTIAYVLIELGDFSKASHFVQKGLQISTDPFYKSMLKAYITYFSDLNYLNLVNQIIKLYNKEKVKFDIATREYYLYMIIRICKKNGLIKKANQYLYELSKLRIH